MEFGFDVPNMHHGLGLEAYVGGADIKRLAIGPETFEQLARAKAKRSGFTRCGSLITWCSPNSSTVAHPLNYQANTGRDDDRDSDRTNVRSEDPIYEALSLLGFLGGRTTAVPARHRRARDSLPQSGSHRRRCWPRSTC